MAQTPGQPELTARERTAFPALAKREAELAEQSAAYEKKAAQYAAYAQKAQDLARQNAQIIKQKQVLEQYVKSLLLALWPQRLQDLQSRLGDMRSWNEADRRFTWLASAFEAARAASKAYQETAKLQAELRGEAEPLEQSLKELAPILAKEKAELAREKAAFEQIVSELRKGREG